MADELDPALEVADEQLDTPVIEEAAPTRTIEEIASKIGWAPKESWKGDPDKWRSAEDFLIVGADAQKGLTTKLKSIEQQVERFGRIAGSIAEEKAAERDAYWKAQQVKAVDDGDQEAADKAVAERVKIAQEASPAAKGPDPTAAAWVAKNEWFNTHPRAAAAAKEVAAKLAADGYDVETQLREAEAEVRERYPHLFKGPAKPAPGVQTGHGRPASASNRAKGFADMPAESQQMARDMVRRNPSVTLEAIAKSYWGDVSNQRRA